ncbi:nucleotidyltransferase [Ochrobactrum sp. 30A/1000/2015]|uniref:nucleotidyltransferase and HEPN domain-containing protein n=1 Tax=Brucella TaxID=234 RepID=UPI00046A7BA1|nr:MULTISPECIES: nucleotidyltransferase and HEPN domain-containing protein [Brucella/Ochrobactrum group]PJT19660.1 nucleotidyltransferase [Ochrobactrum sp. 30A/1000/2015]PJT40910.1 nucleotidyltransferase [Ochrobactrum sp. 27A/999/2015]PJT45465.1 nucleotidyltransferase [Ochrobactrum sp. 23A/997/2015]MCO7735818.1 nucleotidyltransferase and HEPN domain-containing protein [Brucella intermedia]MDL2205230.1 nucleotidyltransferase and HEPN domain-containing protein [Brucella intermedia]
MKDRIDHLPHVKQRELQRVLEVIFEEFEDALKEGSAEFKKRGRIVKAILFGSYARGTQVDEPHTGKGYRSDFDLLIIVNNRKLADFEFWRKTEDRLMRLRDVQTPVNFIVHSLREVNTRIKEGRYFFTDIRKEGIVLYELDPEPLAQPGILNPEDAHRIAKEYFDDRLPHASKFAKGAAFYCQEGDFKEAAFLLHQAIEQAYSTFLLVTTNYSPSSHNLKFLRRLSEGQRSELAKAWPQDQQRYKAWFNIVNEAYVKARYSPHFDITEEALRWLLKQANALIDEIEKICAVQLKKMSEAR